MTHPHVWHDSFIHVWPGDVTHPHVCRDVFICTPWLTHTRHMIHSHVWCDTCTYTQLVYMRDMTHAYVWHDADMCVTWLICMCEMMRSYARHDSFMCIKWLIHMRDMTQSCAQSRHNPRPSVAVCCSVCYGVCCSACCRVLQCIYKRTHSYVWHDSVLCACTTLPMPLTHKCWSVLQCVLQCVAERFRALQSVAVCYRATTHTSMPR